MNIVKLLTLIICLGMPVRAFSEPLSQEKAIARAEEFIVANGYTDASKDRVKASLDHEGIERGSNRDEILKARFNTLKQRAIGVRRGARRGSGWSVAFDYVVQYRSDGREVCRVVTMNPVGEEMRVEHVDGFRNSFVGFDEK